MSIRALQLVREWVDAVNALDVPAVMARSAGNIELGGPRGTSRGQPRLREWVERGRLHLDTRRAFAADDRVVLFQRVTWRDHNGLAVAEAAIAHRFAVADDRVTLIVRHDSLEEALKEAGLTEADEVERG